MHIPPPAIRPANANASERALFPRLETRRCCSDVLGLANEVCAKTRDPGSLRITAEILFGSLAVPDNKAPHSRARSTRENLPFSLSLLRECIYLPTRAHTYTYTKARARARASHEERVLHSVRGSHGRHHGRSLSERCSLRAGTTSSPSPPILRPCHLLSPTRQTFSYQHRRACLT